MKLSCLPVSLYDDLSSGRRTLGDWFRLAAALGLDGADVSAAHVLSRAAAPLAALRDEASGAGVALVMLAAYTDFTHPDPHERARQVDEARAWVHAATQLGAPFVRLTAGQAYEGVSERSGLEWAVHGLTSCLAEAAAGGVCLLYENHVRGAVWARNDFTQRADRFLEVARRTSGTGLGILFDTANNLALDEDPLAVLAAIRDRVGAVHVSDLRCRGTFEPTLVGTGVAPIVPALAALAEGGFDGWVSVEEASRTGEAGLRAAVAFVDRAWVEAGGRPRRPSSS